MIQQSSKNDDSSLRYDVIITHQNFKKARLFIEFPEVGIETFLLSNAFIYNSSLIDMDRS